MPDTATAWKHIMRLRTTIDHGTRVLTDHDETAVASPLTRRQLRETPGVSATKTTAPPDRRAARSNRTAPRPSRTAPRASAPSAPASRSGAARPAGTRSIGKRIAATSFSIAVMAVVGITAVGMTTPAVALDTTDRGIVNATGTLSLSARATGGGDAENYVTTVAGQAQDYAVAGAPAATLDRGGYAAQLTPPKPVAPARSTGSSGSVQLSASGRAADAGFNALTDTGYNPAGWGSNPSPIPAGFSNVSTNYFVNDPGGAVQWPFVVGCPITYGFGWRPGEFHEGADFTPGAGAPIQAIADGTVRLASNSYYGYGATVIIDHVVNGQRVASLYAHMIVGSIRVSAGQQVSVGTVIGQVGASGQAFGANMHFEILQNGTTPVEPVGWLRANAGP